MPSWLILRVPLHRDKSIGSYPSISGVPSRRSSMTPLVARASPILYTVCCWRNSNPLRYGVAITPSAIAVSLPVRIGALWRPTDGGRRVVHALVISPGAGELRFSIRHPSFCLLLRPRGSTCHHVSVVFGSFGGTVCRVDSVPRHVSSCLASIVVAVFSVPMVKGSVLRCLAAFSSSQRSPLQFRKQGGRIVHVDDCALISSGITKNLPLSGSFKGGGLLAMGCACCRCPWYRRFRWRRR